MITVDRINGLSGDLAIKAPVRVATTANITLEGLQTIDGVALAADDRVLVWNQTSAVDNGIWIADTSAWSRARDFDGRFDAVQGTRIPITSGTLYGTGVFQLTTADPVIGTSALTFTQANDLTLAADLASTAVSKGAAKIGRGAIVVSSITALRALIKTDAALHAFVTGYYAQGDGGGGAYWYDSSDTTSVDNGGTIIVATDGGRWKYTNPSMATVHTFGAKGDGVTDDYTAIQATIEYAKAINGVVRLYEKNYKINTPLLVTGTFRSIHFQGAQTGNHQTASTAGTCILFAASGTQSAIRAEFLVFANENVSVDGINFYNPSLDPLNGGSAVTMVRGASNSRYVSGFRFSNMGAQGFANFIRFQGLNTVQADNNWFGNVMIENCSCQGCGIGLRQSNATLNLVTLSNTLFLDAEFGGIYCERDGEVGGGNGKGSAFIGTLCNKTHFEGVGGMFRTDTTTVLNSLAETVRSSITLIDFTHESCGATIGPVAGEPFQLGINTDIHVLGSAVDGIAFGEVAMPTLNSTARIWCDSRMRVIVNGGRIMTPKGVNAPTLYRTILDGNSTTIDVPLVEATAFAVKSHLLLAGGQGGYFEAKHNGISGGAKTNLSTGTAGAGVTVTYNAAADANAVSVTVANASGFTYTAELQVENLSSASITVASDV